MTPTTRPNAAFALSLALLAGCARTPPLPESVDYARLRPWKTLTLKGEKHTVGSFTFSPDGSKAYASDQWSGDGAAGASLLMWDLTSEEPTYAKGASPGMGTIAYAAASDILVTPGLLVGANTKRGVLALYDALDLKKSPVSLQCPSHLDVSGPFTVSPDGEQVVAPLENGKMAVWPLDRGLGGGLINGSEPTLWDGHYHGHPVYSRDGTRLLCGDSRTKVRLLKASSGSVLREYDLPTVGYFPVLAFGPDGKSFAVADAGYVHPKAERKIHIFAVDDNEEQYAFAPKNASPDNAIGHICYTADGKHLVTAGEEGVIQFRNPASGQIVTAIPAPGFGGRFCFSANGKTLAWMSGPTVSIWRVDGP